MERVTEMHEDKDYKGPKEDCVEECMSLPPRLLLSAFPLCSRHLINAPSLPFDPLRNGLRRAETFQAIKVKIMLAVGSRGERNGGIVPRGPGQIVILSNCTASTIHRSMVYENFPQVQIHNLSCDYGWA